MLLGREQEDLPGLSQGTLDHMFDPTDSLIPEGYRLQSSSLLYRQRVYPIEIDKKIERDRNRPRRRSIGDIQISIFG